MKAPPEAFTRQYAIEDDMPELPEHTPELRDMVARTLALATLAEERHEATGRDDWRCIAKTFRFLAEEVANLQPKEGK